MHDNDLILTLTSGLAAALVFGYVARRFRLSPIAGYLLAGIAVGPHTPGFVANSRIAEQLAEVGVILLMFGVGLHFHLEDLLTVRSVALPGAIGQSLVATGLGALMTKGFGWDWSGGIVFGLAISVASTVVLVRVLSDQRDLHTLTGRIAVGWLIVEDLFTVFALVILPIVFGPHAVGFGGLALSLCWAAVKVSLLFGFAFFAGGRAIPWLIEQVAATRSRELFTLSILVMALGLAVGSALLFDVSMALGAFLAGMVVGRSEFSLRAASESLPMRDAFAVLFFVSVGMLLDPRHLLNAPGLVAATLAIIFLGKPLAALGIVLFLGYPLRVALSVSVALAQIGEFSFILGSLGHKLGLLTASGTQTLVAAAIISITLNPLLYRLVAPLEAWVGRRPKWLRWLNARPRMPYSGDTTPVIQGTPSLGPVDRSIVVGYGPIGQTVARLLRENDMEVTIVELNMDTVRQLRQQGITAVYGDASHHDTLEEAGVNTSRSLVLSASEIHGSEEIIRQAKRLNPAIRVLARSAYVRELPSLRQAGAEVAFSGEGEVALAMAETILRWQGASLDQIDRERERVHAELLGRSQWTKAQAESGNLSRAEPSSKSSDRGECDTKPPTPGSPGNS